MKKIVVMGANAARQKTLIFKSLTPGQVNRALKMSEIASGKGINFCRAARFWGKAEAEVVQFAGGDNGVFLINELEKEGITAHSVRCHAQLRICSTCIDQSTSTVTELIEPSGSATAMECDEFVQLFENALNNASGVALCGTLPGETAPELYMRSAELAVKKSLPLLLDFCKDVMPLLDLPGAILKVNREELAKITGESEIASGLSWLFDHRKVRLAAITDGAGCAYASDGKILAKYSIPALPEVVNPIGCGDTASAVFLSELLSGNEFISAFRAALGSASANAETPVPAEFDPCRARELAAAIKVECSSLK